jgi:vibriolysin
MKKITGILLFSISFSALAAKSININHSSLKVIDSFPILHISNLIHQETLNGLKQIQTTYQNGEKISRYQQIYKGLPIVGAQVTISKPQTKSAFVQSSVNGRLYSEVDLDVIPQFGSQRAFEIAKKDYFKDQPFSPTKMEQSVLQIRVDANDQLKLAYLISFKTEDATHKPAWPFFIIDAHTGEVIQHWNNLQTYADNGPGGNEKVHEYWYGQEGLPSIEVSQNGKICSMDSDLVRTVNLNYAWDWQGLNLSPYQYVCGDNREDHVHGAFSVDDDAFYFGHVIVNFFKDWYSTYPLQDENGAPKKLIMRVHFGSYFDNAFWDGQTMTFGDGFFLYPLVSLDIAAHEVAHGFTQNHSNLEYHDESGALNESFSDMAGETARAYLLEKEPNLYNKAYLTPNELTWTIGETVIPPEIPIEAIRFLNLPSLDGESADCVDKKLARGASSICAISYPELLTVAENKYPDMDDRQSFIVHTASGVFNRAFYLLSKQLGVKNAFHLMMIANAKYWTPTTTFKEAACGVLYAANDLRVDPKIIQIAFKKVGIETSNCN